MEDYQIYSVILAVIASFFCGYMWRYNKSVKAADFIFNSLGRKEGKGLIVYLSETIAADLEKLELLDETHIIVPQALGMYMTILEELHKIEDQIEPNEELHISVSSGGIEVTSFTSPGA